MSRALPSYLMDDLIVAYGREDYGGRFREYSEPVEYPARVEQRTRMKDDRGRRRRIADIQVWAGQSLRRKDSPFTSSRKVRVGVRKVGDVVGAGLYVMPGPAARMPFELEREEVVDEVIEGERDVFYPGDRIRWNDKNFEVDSVMDLHSPRGPNHWEFMAHEIGPGAEE